MPLLHNGAHQTRAPQGGAPGGDHGGDLGRRRDAGRGAYAHSTLALHALGNGTRGGSVVTTPGRSGVIPHAHGSTRAARIALRSVGEAEEGCGGQVGWEVARAPGRAGATGRAGWAAGRDRAAAWAARRREPVWHGNPFRRNGVAPTGTPCGPPFLALAVAVPASAADTGGHPGRGLGDVRWLTAGDLHQVGEADRDHAVRDARRPRPWRTAAAPGSTRVRRGAGWPTGASPPIG